MTGRSVFFTTPSLGGVRLHARCAGDAALPTLVLLHGGGANVHWWDHLVPGLTDRFRVVALDFRGHGDSDAPEQLEEGAFQKDLGALLEHLGAPDAALVGHSMGAHVALDHAAAHGRTRAVVAVDPARGGRARTRRAMRLALAARRTYRSAEEAVDRYRFLPPAPGAGEALRRHIAEHSVRREPDGRYGFKIDPRWFSRPATRSNSLPRVLSPVLVLRGQQSPVLSERGAAQVVNELPRAELVVVESAGHNVHLERPEVVVEQIRRFVR